jgi:septal ring factor EnvC (AmiA/AmiB activator)
LDSRADAHRPEERVTALHRPETSFHLRTIPTGEQNAPAQGAADFHGAFDVVTRAAEVMERAEKQARGFRTNALRYFERYESELAQARAESQELHAMVAERDAALQDAELRVRAATLRAKDAEARLEDLRRQLMSIEGELAGSRKWLAYFETHLADRFKNAARALAEMTDASFDVEPNAR